MASRHHGECVSGASSQIGQAAGATCQRSRGLGKPRRAHLRVSRPHRTDSSPRSAFPRESRTGRAAPRRALAYRDRPETRHQSGRLPNAFVPGAHGTQANRERQGGCTMTSQDRMRISLAAARYLEALENGDDAALEALWRDAAADDNLLDAFREINVGILEEALERDATQVQSAVADAVAKHMPSAEIVRPVAGPVTVADVASELFCFPPGNLTA